jgi:hypothetical protein
LKHKEFVDNVDPPLQKQFKILFDKHFETGNKISGIWVQEGFYKKGQYLGEKCYTLHNDNNNFLCHMKGLNIFFQNKFIQEQIDIKKFPCINYNTFSKGKDFTIFKSYVSKDLFSNFVPIKRYFINGQGSLPLKL